MINDSRKDLKVRGQLRYRIETSFHMWKTSHAVFIPKAGGSMKYVYGLKFVAEWMKAQVFSH